MAPRGRRGGVGGGATRVGTAGRPGRLESRPAIRIPRPIRPPRAGYGGAASPPRTIRAAAAASPRLAFEPPRDEPRRRTHGSPQARCPLSRALLRRGVPARAPLDSDVLCTPQGTQQARSMYSRFLFAVALAALTLTAQESMKRLRRTAKGDHKRDLAPSAPPGSPGASTPATAPAANRSWCPARCAQSNATRSLIVARRAVRAKASRRRRRGKSIGRGGSRRRRRSTSIGAAGTTRGDAAANGICSRAALALGISRCGVFAGAGQF